MGLAARFLMLLACGPLLQPVGLCVCRGGESGRLRAAVCPHLPADAPKSCCRKCAKPEAPASVNTPRPPMPEPTPHLPGCPASPGADSLKWIEPAPSALMVADAPAPLEAIVLAPSGGASFGQPHLSIPPPRPPRGLTNCVLVI